MYIQDAVVFHAQFTNEVMSKPMHMCIIVPT